MINIRLAVFGESGSGKTTLLTRFYGDNREGCESFPYKLKMSDAIKGRRLLQSYYFLKKDKQFPQPNFTYNEYNFNLFSEDNKGPYDVLNIEWYDYPGKWWTQTAKEEEQKQIEKAITSILSSDIGLLLIDGKRFFHEKDAYLKKLFQRFAKKMTEFQKYTKGWFGRSGKLPKKWIIVLTKSDVFSDDFSASEFQETVLQYSLDELENLGEILNNIHFGTNFLNLTCLTKPEEESSLSTRLLIPAALECSIRRAAEDQAPGIVTNIAQGTTDWVAKLIELAHNLDSFLPKEMRLIDQSLSLLKLRDMAEGARSKLEAYKNQCENRSQKMTLELLLILSQLSSEGGKKHYFTNQYT